MINSKLGPGGHYCTIEIFWALQSAYLEASFYTTNIKVKSPDTIWQTVCGNQRPF